MTAAAGVDAGIEVRDARPGEAAEIAALLRASITGLCAADHRGDPAAWLAMRDIYGATADAPAFTEAFAGWLHGLWSDGTEATLRCYVG